MTRLCNAADTPLPRLVAAWAVAGAYALIAFLTYMATPVHHAGSTFDTVRDELQEDIKLMKDVV